MRLDDNVRFDLEQLKNCFILDEKARVLIVTGWKEEDINICPLFGRCYKAKAVTEIHAKTVDTLSTKFVKVFTEDLSHVLDWLKLRRKAFVNMRNELDKFGYVIKGKNK